MTKVSVIIPVYNVEKYLRECLDSVINQTLSDIEIICVNDGSTDNSLAILEEYAQKDTRIKIISKRNEGAGKARQAAIKKASGEYLAFLDGDDYYKSDFVEKMYASAKKNNSDITICNISKYNIKTNVYTDISKSVSMQNIPTFEPFCAGDMPDYIFTSFQNWNWNKIYKRSFIEAENIHFQALHRTNDLYFTCCALVMAKRISTVKEPLVVYRIGMTDNSQSTNHLYPFDFYKAFKALRLFLKKKHVYNFYKQSYVNWALAGCIHNINSINEYKTIQQSLIKLVVTKGMKDLDLESTSEVVPQHPRKFIHFEKIKTTYYNTKTKIIRSRIDYIKNIIHNIFSVKNKFYNGEKTKIVTVFGIKIKIKKFRT